MPTAFTLFGYRFWLYGNILNTVREIGRELIAV